jgi:AraC-like DNA-binding protein
MPLATKKLRSNSALCVMKKSAPVKRPDLGEDRRGAYVFVDEMMDGRRADGKGPAAGDRFEFHGARDRARIATGAGMLADLGHDRLKVGDIAAVCGFNEVAYFNRCFRRLFGASPTQSRGGATSQD